jgi:hypothetical protein
VFGNHLALFEQGRWFRQRQPGGERTGLLKYPRIADATASDRHAVDSCVAQHVDTRLRIEQIAAAYNDTVTGILLELLEKLPA